ncbi:MAG: MerR family transcriptional regulator [Meiothermus sp.]|nr:MerR family transcriptional regulator [Meiothermus sp.]
MELFSIGEAASRAGVSVQTLRHYDKLGLVAPSQVTEAGYRLYSPADCARLELLRTLRGLGFDLGTIAGLLGGAVSVGEAVQLQLEALELQTRALKRQQTVLRAVMLGGSDEARLSRLQRMQSLARLDKLEREDFLATHLKKAMGGRTGDPGVWKAAVLDLPEELTEEGLEVWLELAEIATSGRFQQTLSNQMRPLKGLTKAQNQAWSEQTQGLIAEAVRAVREGRPASSPESQALIRHWLEALARVMRRKPTPRFVRWLLKYFRSAHDPLMDRYWELVAKLKGWEYTPVYGQAFAWLLKGLEAMSRG